MQKRLSILFLLLALASGRLLFSQDLVELKGSVVDKKTNEPVIGAAVNIMETEQWTVTDQEGNFTFKDVRAREYTIQVQCLCYEHLETNIVAEPGKPVKIQLSPTSYDMEEVNVLAKKGTGITTSTTIGSAAIEHVQATGLSDIMQLLPGNIVENPDLSKPQQISIREIGTDQNTSMGTSILIDNAPISNNANLQTFSTSVSRADEFSSVAGGGVDLRQISSDNIESVEVIKGIPSVVYGDMTSGAVVVHTKAGYSPLEVRLKTDPLIKQAALTKGVQIPSTNSFLNFNVDYLSSYDDLVSKYKGFKRLTAQTAYSTTFMKSTMPLTFDAKLNIYGTLDNSKTDPDALVALEEYESKDQGIRLNVKGKWSLNKKLLTDLQYTYSVSYAHQESYEKMYRTTSSGVTPISLALEEGENYGIFLPTESLTELRIDGKPVNVFAQMTLNKLISFREGIINKVLAGAEYRFDGNYGDGQIYDIANPPFISSHSSRPRSFKDIPAMQSYSLYLEDKVIVPIGSTKLNVQAGARLNNYQPVSVVKSNVGWYLEPRLNISYDILNNRNNKLFQLLTINAGIGQTYKSPSLLYLYPDRAYYDITVLDYYTDDEDTRTYVFYSRSFNTENPELKPYENLKKELGLDLHVGPLAANVTAFKEKLTNGFYFQTKYEFIDRYYYDASSIPVGTKPDLSTLDTTHTDYIIGYNSPVNSRETDKSGVEFAIDFGKIKALYTSFSVDGAYLKTIRTYNTVDFPNLPSSGKPEQFDQIGMYRAGESKVSERLNTRLQMVTQIPQLRMIFTTTLQMIWFDKYYYPYYDTAPIYLFDKDGVRVPYTEEMKTDPAYMKYYTDRSEFYYLEEVLPPLFLANVRLSKEIGEVMKLSLFVNNFLNYRPLHQYTRFESYVRRNPSIYFGAEVTFKI